MIISVLSLMMTVTDLAYARCVSARRQWPLALISFGALVSANKKADVVEHLSIPPRRLTLQRAFQFFGVPFI